MFLVLRIVTPNETITNRNVPLYQIQGVYSNKQKAMNFLIDKQQELYNIGIWVQIKNDTLYTNCIPGFIGCDLQYKIKEVPLYGRRWYKEGFVYQLCMIDDSVNERRPYGYIPLGWYSDIRYAKISSEWMTARALARNPDFDGFEYETEIYIFSRYDIAIKVYLEEFPIQ